MNRKLRIGLIVFYVLIIVIAVAALVYVNFFSTAEIGIRNTSLFSLILTFCVGLARLENNNQPSSLRIYKKTYADIIKDSFEEDKKTQKKFLKALYFYNDNKSEKAAEILNSLLPLCQTSNEKYSVNLFLALVYGDLGMAEKELEIYESMKLNGLADSRIFSNLMNIYIDKGWFDKAFEAGNAAIKLNPENPVAYNNIAYLCYDDGDYESAVKYAKRCLELKANQLQAIKLLYLIYSLQGDEQAAIYEKKALANGASKKELQEMLN